jgi:hypothetical protein
MTVEQWIFRRGVAGTDFTTSVISFSGTAGRQNYLDNYGGGTFQITIKNQANEAANFTRGLEVQIVFSTGNTFAYGTVSGVTFSDYPGNTGLSTATIVCQDELTRAGKFTLQDFAGYSQQNTTRQAERANEAFTGLKTPDVARVGEGSSTAQAVTLYNGTILDRLNLLNNTERGTLVAASAGIFFMARSEILDFNTVNLHRSTSSATSIAYTALRRINALDNFRNQVTVSRNDPAGTALAPVFANNTDSQTANGIAGFNFESADFDSTQATGLASWISYTQGDPTTLRFEVDFDDATANTTAIRDFILNYQTFHDSASVLTWRVPGAGGDTATNVVAEGYSFSGVPEQTSYTFYFSPAFFYDVFILDSTESGILNTSRLGW